MGKHIPIPVGPFKGGINLIDPPGEVDSNELILAENYRLDVKGLPYKRPGSSFIGSSPAKLNGNNPVNFVGRYYKAGGSKFLLGVANGKLYKVNDTTGAPTQIDVDGSGATNMNTSNLFSKFAYKDRYYILDGTKPVRFNGTDAPYAGFFAHAAPTIGTTAGGGGVGAGTYKYAVANIAGDMGEGPIGTPGTVVTAANDTVNLSVISDAPSRYEQSAKRIYRTKLNGSSFFFLAEIANTVTTYNDITPDTALSQQYIPVHNPKTDARFALLGYDDRIYWFGMGGASASLVEVSDIGFPDRIFDNEFLTIANNDSDILTGGGKTPSGLIFFKRNSMWLSRAFNSAPINISPKVGTVSPFSVVEVPGGLIFLATRGEIYFYDGVNLTEIGRKVKPELIEMPSASLAKVVAIYHDFRYIISYDPRGTKGYNWKTLEYDLLTGKWDGPHQNGDYLTPNYYCAYDSERDKNELVWGESKAGSGSYLYIRQENVFLDRTSKIPSTLKTGSTWVDAYGEVILSKATLEGRFSSDSELTLSVLLDDEFTEIVCTPIEATGSNSPRFGIAKFGTDKFSSIIIKVGEDPLAIGARSNKPILKIADHGTSTTHKLEKITMLGTALPMR